MGAAERPNTLLIETVGKSKDLLTAFSDVQPCSTRARSLKRLSFSHSKTVPASAPRKQPVLAKLVYSLSIYM